MVWYSKIYITVDDVDFTIIYIRKLQLSKI